MSEPFSKLKSFFKKKKLDSKFKNAGEGHRLCDDTYIPKFDDHICIHEPGLRFPVSESSVRAGEAALQRVQKQQEKPRKPQLNDKDDLKKQVIQGKEELNSAYEFRERALVKEIHVDKPDQLKELNFYCPDLLDPSEIGSYSEIEQKILNYIESAKLELPIYSSALLIQCLNKKNLELLESSKNIVKTLLQNIIDNVDEPKYRKIRLGNEKIRQNIVEVKGVVDFLMCVGFKPTKLPKPNNPDENDDYLVLNDEDCDTSKIKQSLETFLEARPIKPILYRNTMVIYKNKAVNYKEEDLPSEFFRMSLDEAKKLSDLRKQQIEESGMLLTKEMRENLKKKDKRKYRYALIRVTFPNNFILQGHFVVTELLSDVYAWIMDCLKVDHPFSLSVPPITRKIIDFSQSLLDMDLVPCSNIRLTFDNHDLNDCPNQNVNLFLKDELIQQIS